MQVIKICVAKAPHRNKLKALNVLEKKKKDLKSKLKTVPQEPS